MTKDQENETLAVSHFIQGLSKLFLVVCPCVALWSLNYGGLIGGLCSILSVTGTVGAYDALQLGKQMVKFPVPKNTTHALEKWTENSFILGHIVSYLHISKQ